MGDNEARIAELERRLRQLELTGKPASQEVPAEVKAAIADGDYILATKRLREATGMGLAEAKQVIDALEPKFAQRQRTWMALVFWIGLIVLGVLIWWFADTLK